MNGIRVGVGLSGRLGLAGAVAVLCSLAPACSSLAPRVDPSRPTSLMEKTGTTMSAVEMRRRVDDLVAPLLTLVELNMDQVRAESTDPDVRRRALQLKIDAIPVMYRAAFQPDPLASILDVWLLSYQMEDCLERAEGPCELGDQQRPAHQRAGELRRQFEGELFRVGKDSEALRAMREEVRDVARRFPLTGEGAIARRYTMTAQLAEAVGSQSRDAFNVIGDVSLTLAELSHRLNTYIGDVGRLGRWHAELLVEDLARRPEVVASVADVHGMAGDLGRVGGALESIERTLGPESVGVILARTLGLISDERRAVLADVERQRELTLEYASAERALVLAAVAAEREAVLAQVHQERVDTLLDLDRLGERYLDDTTRRAFEVVDHLVWRLAQLGGGLLLLAALLAWLALRARVRLAVSTGEDNERVGR